MYDHGMQLIPKTTNIMLGSEVKHLMEINMSGKRNNL
jgi:hypothetical protein